MNDQERLDYLRRVALATGDPAALAAYGKAELERLKGQPRRCWQCGAEVPDTPDAETCPACGVDLVPF